jgi:phage-related protein
MWDIYDYLTPSGRNDIYKWAKGFSNERRGKFEEKLDVLRKHGVNVPKDLLAYLGNDIYKLKVQGKPQLRPLLCRGVKDKNLEEFTIFIGVTEENGELRPKDAIDQARKRLAELLENPDQRCEHETTD